MRFSLFLASAALLAAVASAGSAAPEGLERALHSRSHEQKMVHRNNMQVRAEEAQLLDIEKRGSWLITGIKATWYGGGQLDAPACGGKAPKSSDYVVAVPTSSAMKCGDTLHIHRGNRKMVSAVVRDLCAGCDKNQIDMTRGLFSALGNLDDGVLSNLRIRVIRN